MQQRYAGPAGLARFAEAVAGSLVDQRLRVPEPDRFRADMGSASVGDVSLIEAAIGPLQSTREAGTGAAGSVFLLLAQRGSGVLEHRGGRELIAADRLVVIPGAEGFAVGYADPASLLFVTLPAPRVSASFPALDGPVRSVPLGDLGGAVAAQLPFVLRAARAEDALHADELGGLLDSVLHLLLRGSIGDTAGDPLVALRIAAERTAARHLDDPQLSVGWLARRLAVSVRQLHRAFATAGATPAEHLRRARLGAAARALAASPGTTVAEVAARYGFASASHLGVRFRAEYGTTPVEWRTRHARDRDPADR